eukprot:GHVN01033808.1.p3 GENE.GHVN01033808.1~~GHVN01033808.1.p3  ORF type:complete len:162 (+),score=27.78 GHVN01033808.1:659-1144(+)
MPRTQKIPLQKKKTQKFYFRRRSATHEDYATPCLSQREFEPDKALSNTPATIEMTSFENSQKAAVYASLILHDEELPITAENILKITQAADVKIERIWAELFEKTFKGKNIGDFLTSITPKAAAPQASAEEIPALKKEEKKKAKPKSDSDSDEGMGMGLFD